jgi:nicotinate-nucleotide adenylyltransferase
MIFPSRVRWLLFSVLFLIASCKTVPLGSSYSKDDKSSAAKVAADEAAGQQAARDAEIKFISNWLGEVQQGLSKRFGIERIYIGGGSARAILDFIYHGKPVEMRDFDVFAVADREVTKELGTQIGEALASKTLGIFSKNDLRPRPRGNDKLPIPEAHNYNAGYGFFWLNNDRIFDLSVYHSQEALSLNGIFDFDMVMLQLSANERLTDWVALAASGVQYEKLVADGKVIDVFGGYRQWENQSGSIIHWTEVGRDPLLNAIRVIRSYTKIKATSIPPEEEAKLRSLIENAASLNKLQIVRNLLKLLEDADYARELKMLDAIGVFEKWHPSLHRVIAQMSEDKINLALGNGEANQRFDALVRLVAPESRAPIYDDWALVDAQFVARTNFRSEIERVFADAAEGIRARIVQLKDVVVSGRTLQVEIGEIQSSEALSAEEKLQLTSRAVLRRMEAAARREFLDGLHPTMELPKRVEILQAATVSRFGFITGVFNPFHSGHLDVVKKSRSAMNLDQMFVMPTPATNHNERPIAWEHRLEMAKLGLSDVFGVTVIDPSMKEFLLRGTGAGINELLTRHGSGNQWIQVMGADSFERYAEGGRIEQGIAAGRDVLVVSRPGTELVLAGNSQHASIHWLQSPSSGEYSESNRSSTLVRNNIAAGKPISDLVPPAVEKYIMENHLYTRLSMLRDRVANMDCDAMMADMLSVMRF